MKHGVKGRTLNRTASHRLAMLRNMVTSLIEHEKIRTTVPKAKELRKLADKMVTLAKDGSIYAKRKAFAVVRTPDAVNKLFKTLGPRFTERPGGYTRIAKAGFRLGDAAPMATIEYLPAGEPLIFKGKPEKFSKFNIDNYPGLLQLLVKENQPIPNGFYYRGQLIKKNYLADTDDTSTTTSNVNNNNNNNNEKPIGIAIAANNNNNSNPSSSPKGSIVTRKTIPPSK